MSELNIKLVEFEAEMLYALDKFDWGKSPLDAKSVMFLNGWTSKLHEVIEEERRICGYRIEPLRIGQNMFNFLEWLKDKKGLDGGQNSRMADPFYLTDDKWNTYYQEYKQWVESQIVKK